MHRKNRSAKLPESGKNIKKMTCGFSYETRAATAAARAAESRKLPKTTQRKSTRISSSCVLAKKMSELQKAIHENREVGLVEGFFKNKGRGVVATQRFTRGQFVVEYAGELIGPGEARARETKYARNPNTGCYMYYFKHGGRQYCIDATPETGRLGRLVNHSRNGNLVGKAVWVDKPRLVMYAARDIEPGVELTYDYGDRSKQSLRYYPWLAR